MWYIWWRTEKDEKNRRGSALGVRAGEKSSRSYENQRLSEAHPQSLGTEDLKTLPDALNCPSALSLSLLSLSSKSSKSSSLHAP